MSSCPAHAVTPVASSASLTTNSDAMKITAGSPKPASAWSRSSTPVAQSVSAAPIATISTGRRSQTNSATTAPRTRKVMVVSLIGSVESRLPQAGGARPRTHFPGGANDRARDLSRDPRDGAVAHARADRRPGPARAYPRNRVPGRRPWPAAGGARRRGRVAPRRGCRGDRDAVPSRHGAGDHGVDPGPRGRADRAPLRALRRRASRRRVALELAAVGADDPRRRDVRPRRLRLEGERDRPCRRAARLERQAARRDQARDRGPGGGRERAQHAPARPTPTRSAPMRC